MKKDKSFSKIARLPDSPPTATQAPPPDTACITHQKPNINQPETNQNAGTTGTLNISIPKTLHAQLREQANAEGVSLQTYIVYKLSQ